MSAIVKPTAFAKSDEMPSSRNASQGNDEFLLADLWAVIPTLTPHVVNAPPKNQGALSPIRHPASVYANQNAFKKEAVLSSSTESESRLSMDEIDFVYDAMIN